LLFKQLSNSTKVNILKFQKEQLIILITASVLLGGFALLRFIPLAGHARSVRTAKAESELQRKHLEEYRKKLPVLKKKIEKYQIKVGDFDAKIPVDRKFASLCNKITDLMNEYKLQNQLIQPGKEIIGENVNSVKLDINCSGKLRQVFGFFKAIENLERVVRIDNLDMKSETDFDIISVKANAIVYYRSNQNI